MDQETIEKSGIQLGFRSRGGLTQQVELVRGSYENGETAVSALLSDPAEEDFGQLWSSITVDLDCELQNGATVLLDTNNMDDGLLRKVIGLGAPAGDYVRYGFCAYPAFTFDADVMGSMRDVDEFFAVKR